MPKSGASFKLFLPFPAFFPYFPPVRSGMILAIETSVETGSVALVSPDGVVIERSFFAGRKPSATLWPALVEVMEEAAELTAVVVGTGPGSYNGTRVGIAAGQGIALIRGCPTVGLSSFEGVSLETGAALAIGDARRKSFSAQTLSAGMMEGHFALLSAEELAEKVEASLNADREVFCFEDVARFPLPDSLLNQVQQKFSQASLLGKAYWDRSDAERLRLTKQLLQPSYLRDPHITVGKRASLLD